MHTYMLCIRNTCLVELVEVGAHERQLHLGVQQLEDGVVHARDEVQPPYVCTYVYMYMCVRVEKGLRACNHKYVSTMIRTCPAAEGLHLLVHLEGGVGHLFLYAYMLMSVHTYTYVIKRHTHVYI